MSPDEIAALDRQLRSFRVRLSPEGTITGRINVFDPDFGSMAALENLKIVFVQNGRVVAQAHTTEGGAFTATLEPGVYALVAAGPQGYAAYGVQVVKADESVIRSIAYQEIKDTVQIDGLAIPPRDFAIAKRLVRTYVPKELLEEEGADSPLARPTEPLPPREDDAEATGAADTNLRSHSVVILSDGSIQGRMRRLHPTTGQPLRIRRLNVFLVQDNAVLSQASVNEAGLFKFKGVNPGMYSFVASGSEGLAAFAFQAVNQSVAQKGTPSELTLVAFHAEGGSGTSGSTTGPENAKVAADELEKLDEEEEDDAGAGAVVPGGGGGGRGGLGGVGGFVAGGGGGGGGGGGAGGFGTAFGAAALAGGIAAAIDNSNNSGSVVSPANF